MSLDHPSMLIDEAAIFSMQMAVAYALPSGGGGGAPDSLSKGSEITFDEPAYALRAGEQGDFDSEVLQLVYSSLTTPRTVIAQNLATGKRSEESCWKTLTKA